MAKHPFDDGRSWAVLPAGVLALGLAGWMTPASSGSPVGTIEVRRPALAPAPRQIRPEAQAQLHLARLSAYTDAVTRPQLLERSPFEFGRPRRAGSASPVGNVGKAEPAASPLGAPLELRPTPPALVGIAEQNESGGVVRTAIFTDADGSVRFALIGEMAGAFRVAAIESSRVVLVGPGGEPSTLVLK